MAYSADDKATALAIIRRCGGMTNEAMQLIADTLGRKVSKSTVFGWLPADFEQNRTENRTEPNRKKDITLEQINNADKPLDKVFEEVARKYLTRATEDSAINDTRGKDAVMAAAIAVDKMRLLQGLPTEIVAILPGLVDELNRAGLSPADVFLKMMQKVSDANRQQFG